jgi:hypothetical protein
MYTPFNHKLLSLVLLPLQAKGDHDAVMNNINTQQSAANTQNQQIANTANQQVANAGTQDTSLMNQVTSNATNMGSQGYIDSLFNSVGGVGGVSGGIDQSTIDQMGAVPYAGYQTMSQGLTPQFTNAINPTIQTLATGGVDSAAQQNYLGDGTYQNFATTGGMTDQQQQQYLAQSLSPLYATYANAQNSLDQSRALAGGNMANYGAVQSQMARQLGTTAAQQSTNAQSGLNQQLAANKLAGAQGLTQGQAALSSQQSQNEQASVSAQIQVQQLNAQMQAAGLAGMTQIEQDKLQAELQNAQINEQASYMNDQVKLQSIGLQAGIQSNANQQLLGAYSATPGALAQSENYQLQNQGQNNQANLGYINAQIGASQIPGNFQSALGNIGSLIGLGSNAVGATQGALGNNQANASGGGGGIPPGEVGYPGTTPTSPGVDPSNPTPVTGAQVIDPNTGLPYGDSGTGSGGNNAVGGGGGSTDYSNQSGNTLPYQYNPYANTNNIYPQMG